MTPAEYLAARRAQRAKLQQVAAELSARPRLSTPVRCPFCGWCLDEEGRGHASDTCAGIAPVEAPKSPPQLALTPAPPEK